MPKSLQAKLLRFLESREIRRVGENEPFQVDVRVLGATNRDLRDMVANDEFREDLFFRINTFELRLPPLRERREDIPLLAEHLLVRAARGKDVANLISQEAINVLTAYDWPGNVREMANVMEYAFILSGGKAITAEHLPASVTGRTSSSPSSAMVSASVVDDKVMTLHELELQYISKVLDQNEGNKPETAKQLGISLKTLYNRVNAMSQQPDSRAS